ncbi:hypothetical protein ASPZODRAFT_26546 [Penicilliopsis zonata CBS 506.65]|uniref:Aminotransferase class I/classII large domain-containing protein n=1 Tax=Penicilliopsis zonata CBS 506.65 TaxID=1073090 RepID=A0A1L9SFQ8_9EURO|nr:hypothetical protein ASPZODRAFT_26546 [Penicilliopsis zonata CBS 506.65]OJJ45953.1 hypothetical protein ASPZODRAFT_26546 [Penicilliopsis zonata CBS 506.65]
MLSNRMQKNVDSFMPKIAVQVAQRSADVPPIDLGTAENRLIRHEMVEIIKQAIQDNLTVADLSYQKGFAGDPRLQAALAHLFSTRFHALVPVQASEVVVGPGGGAIIDSFAFSVGDVGDAMLVLAPYWSGFSFQFEVRPDVTIIPVHVSCDDPGEIAGMLETALAEQTRAGRRVRAVVGCNPHNPLGQCFTRDVLTALLLFCQARELHYLSDEVYALSTYESEDCPAPEPFTSVLALDLPALGVDVSRVHMAWSISKDLACNGLRLGTFVSRNPQVALAVALGANTQVSALTAIAMTSLLTNEAQLEQILKLSRTRLQTAYAAMRRFLRAHEMEYIPAWAGMYVWARLDKTITTWEQETALQKRLADHGVAVSAGRSYSSQQPGWYRLSFALEGDALAEGLRRIEAACV